MISQYGIVTNRWPSCWFTSNAIEYKVQLKIIKKSCEDNEIPFPFFFNNYKTLDGGLKQIMRGCPMPIGHRFGLNNEVFIWPRFHVFGDIRVNSYRDQSSVNICFNWDDIFFSILLCSCLFNIGFFLLALEHMGIITALITAINRLLCF